MLPLRAEPDPDARRPPPRPVPLLPPRQGRPRSSTTTYTVIPTAPPGHALPNGLAVDGYTHTHAHAHAPATTTPSDSTIYGHTLDPHDHDH